MGQFMNNTYRLIIDAMLVALIAAYSCNAWSEEPESEQQLIAILASNASPQQKDAVCVKLKRVGTAAAVPSLASLLADKDLSHSARYALETVPAHEAVEALSKALDETTGLLQAAILNSLHVRNALPPMEKLAVLLQSTDELVASAAASALGATDHASAGELLVTRLQKSKSASLKAAIYDAMLAHAYLLRDKASLKNASSAFNAILAQEAPDHIRTAAIAGIIASAEPARALSLLSTHLHSADASAQQAALRMARELRSPEVTKVLCDSLSQLKNPAMQVAVIEALHQRADTAAADTLIKMLDSEDAAVRIAAIQAVGDLADGRAVAPLARIAALQTETERRRARLALGNLRHGDVTAALVAALVDAPANIHPEIVRALIVRGDTGSSDKLFPLAEKGNRPAATVLGRLARVQDFPALVALVQKMNPENRNAVVLALQRACARFRGMQIDVAPLQRAVASSDARLRAALLPAVIALGDGRLRDEVRNALRSNDAALLLPTLKALQENQDNALLHDLVTVARSHSDDAVKTAALAASLKVATDATTTGLSTEQRVEALETIAPIATRTEDKWAVLSGLADSPTTKSLALALPMLADSATQAEASTAINKIAAALPPAEKPGAIEALQKVLSAANNENQRQAATTALEKLTTTTTTTH
jgi:HEAT repeat protein